MKKLSRVELVNLLDRSLLKMAFGDVEKASLRGEAKMAGFILGSCLIDAMAGYYCGATKQNINKKAGVRFKKFVQRYMPNYDPKNLYSDLRCYLVHSYSEGGSFVFTHANRVGGHFDTTKDGRKILNLEDFCSDLRIAYRNLRLDILTNNVIFGRARKRFESISTLLVFPIN